jgi:2-oxo-4-hydroxy-4-carboxy-5-ureidoimidazoline decarboxylase
MRLDEFNRLPRYRAEEELSKCCSSRAWVRAMAQRRPFASSERLAQAAGEIWWKLDSTDWLEAFRSHPRIGDLKISGSAAQEQAAMNRAPTAVADALALANCDYFDKFGFIFIICATGKSGEEMLENLRSRLPNSPDQELRVAAEEQNKITLLRLKKAFPL